MKSQNKAISPEIETTLFQIIKNELEIYMASEKKRKREELLSLQRKKSHDLKSIIHSQETFSWSDQRTKALETNKLKLIAQLSEIELELDLLEKRQPHLTIVHRKYLQILLDAGISKTKIAEALNVHISTIYREIKRNAKHQKYQAIKAHQFAKTRKKVVGSMSKTKPRKTSFTFRTKYFLYAERREIFWRSDSSRERRKYKFVFQKKGFKYHIYALRLSLPKLYHFKNDWQYFQLLIEYPEVIFQPVKKNQKNIKTLVSENVILPVILREVYSIVA
ncbi:helix-turn-helix domain-containing protein [Flammeovirga aprica]|uniref:Helix-turn-helix domain-containing protein n=1 Tax=Flammeovirga aprica JL-4 TaxID=694437 RepID=A0A7X9P2S9_9BACT|nr:helix-turn-helix domain-containing protein [Flammeovirga aprica]NME67362.1 helix-turn-helix domain-containing protein [Flammeovirga aprica JL-4]